MLKISGDIYYISGLVGLNVSENSKIDLDSVADLNLKGNYQFNEKLGAFIYVNNLLNSNYSLYSYYPVNGINVLGGITLNF